jgi:polyisoprenoid-binding protein YceI
VTAPATENTAVRYVIDRSSSKFTVRVFATGMLSALGHSPTFAIRKFEGEVTFSPNAPQASSLHLQVEANSLEVMDDISNKDRQEIESTMNQTVLETEKYPAITFDTRSATVEALGGNGYRASLSGNLALHGVSQAVVIPVIVTQMGDMLRAGGEFLLLQTDFGITLVKVAGGALKVKDELKFIFEIVARKSD